MKSLDKIADVLRENGYTVTKKNLDISKQESLEDFVERLDESKRVRVYNSLKHENINTVGDIIQFIKDRGCIRRIRNIGKKSAEPIYKLLKQNNLL